MHIYAHRSMPPLAPIFLALCNSPMPSPLSLKATEPLRELQPFRNSILDIDVIQKYSWNKNFFAPQNLNQNKRF